MTPTTAIPLHDPNLFEDEAKKLLLYFLNSTQTPALEAPNLWEIKENNDCYAYFGVNFLIFPVAYLYFIPLKNICYINVREFIAFCKNVLQHILQNGVNRIECHVSKNKRHLKFVEFLGFSKDAELRRFGPNGETYLLYSLIGNSRIGETA